MATQNGVYEVWPAANGDDDPAEFRIERDGEIIAWVYSEFDAELIVYALAALSTNEGGR